MTRLQRSYVRWRTSAVLRTGAAAGAVVPATVGAQVLRLTIRDSVSNEGLADVVVAVLASDGSIAASGITRSAGALSLRLRGPGQYAVFARKLGFSPATTEPFDVGADSTAREVFMRRIPQFLASVAVRAERESIRSGRLFGMKIGSLSASIISPTQVDGAVLGALDYTDLVSRNPSPSILVDYERKCVLSNRGDPPGCLPVIVDGLLTSTPNDVVPPETVDYMIVLRGNELGVLYGTIGENGAVLIFTKRGPKRGPRDR